MSSPPVPTHDPEAPDVPTLVRTVALFRADSLVNAGAFDAAPAADRLAVALLQFDFATLQTVLPTLADAGLRSRIARLVFLQDDPTSVMSTDAAPAFSDGAADDDDDAGLEALNAVVSALEGAAAVVLGGAAPGDVGLDGPLQRYMFARLLHWAYGSLADFPESLFVRDDMSEGELYCACLYYIETGQLEPVSVTLEALTSSYSRSGHLFHLKHRHALNTDACYMAGAYLLNTGAVRGVDERTAERLWLLFGIRPARQGARDIGLRGIAGMLNPDSFADGPGGRAGLNRPDGLDDADFSHTDQDLRAARDRALGSVSAAADPEDWTRPMPRDPATTQTPAAPGGFLVVFPPKACPDISAVLSSVTPYPPISHPVLDRVARNIGKVEPAWTGRLTPAILQAHGSFLRRMWITFVRKELGPLSFSRPRWYLTGAVDQVRALRAFWPQAKIHLLVPDDESLTALRDAGVPVEVFGTVYRWRHGGDLVRLLKTLGVDRAGRRSLHGRLPELRRLFYPV